MLNLDFITRMIHCTEKGKASPYPFHMYVKKTIEKELKEKGEANLSVLNIILLYQGYHKRMLEPTREIVHFVQMYVVNALGKKYQVTYKPSFIYSGVSYEFKKKGKI